MTTALLIEILFSYFAFVLFLFWNLALKHAHRKSHSFPFKLERA